jgi:very-short-patch-repair endonuclease/predicted transcriptional regulator of viral defense system
MHALWREVFALASEHHGLITRAALRRIGLTDRMIDAAREDGVLARVAPCVYRVGGAPQTERMAIAAGVLATTGNASHASAQSLLRLDAPVVAVPIEVTVDADQHHPTVRSVAVETAARSFHPLRVHRFGSRGEPVLIVDGIRCTDAARTLIDLAGRLGMDQLEDAFERARRLGLVSAPSLARRFELVGGRGRKGAPKVREVLAHTRPGLLDSKLEGRVWRLIRSSSSTDPVRQLRVDVTRGTWYRIDFAWPQLLVAVEAEGFEWHGSRARWKADRIRVAALERLGWRVLVVTWDDVTQRRAETLDRIAMALAERARLAAAG